MLFVGKAQERASDFRTERRRSESGATYPRLFRSTAMLNQHYFYMYHENVGPLFIKLYSYFPFRVKLYINGDNGSSASWNNAASGSKYWTMVPCIAMSPRE